jgi:hypothetical protein
MFVLSYLESHLFLWISEIEVASTVFPKVALNMISTKMMNSSLKKLFEIVNVTL